MLKFIKLTQNILVDNIDKICEIEKNACVTSGGTYTHMWEKSNFMLDLPEKWTYSRVIYKDENIVGFCIASQKVTQGNEKVVHGHRVATVQEVRNPRLLLNTLNDIFEEARRNDLKWFTGIQMGNHPIMLAWYIRVLKCYIPKNRRHIEYFLGKLPESIKIYNDGHMDSEGLPAHYLIVKRL